MNTSSPRAKVLSRKGDTCSKDMKTQWDPLSRNQEEKEAAVHREFWACQPFTELRGMTEEEFASKLAKEPMIQETSGI